MTIKPDVKWKIVVNGQEYGSVDEMPARIREAYEKAVGKAPGLEPGKTPGATVTRILFDGQEYACVDSMPDEVRLRYESIMKMAQAGESTTASVPRIVPKPIAPETGLSPRTLAAGAAIIALLFGLYLLIQLLGSR